MTFENELVMTEHKKTHFHCQHCDKDLKCLSKYSDVTYDKILIVKPIMLHQFT